MSGNVLITGASRGIGKACALKLAQNGYHVAVGCSRPSASASASLEAVLKYDKNAFLLPFDVSSEAQVNAASELALARMGRIDTLILSAGVAFSGLFQYTDSTVYDKLMNVNVKGAFLTVKAFLPQMISEHSGSIIFISSMWGQTGGSLEVVYSASKAALIGMSKALAKEVGPSGIRVNCIAPGVIETDMTAPLGREALDALANEAPLCRNGIPEDIASAALFLASEEASFITGQVIGVNGGLVI